MSGIAAVFNRTGKPGEGWLIAALTEAARWRGRDGLALRTSRAAALGHLHFHTTPESVDEPQPLMDRESGIALSLDGRIDNRAELIAELNAAGFFVRGRGDGEIILRAWQCWGEEFPRRVLGDFALVLWDAARRTIYCARDIAGVRPVYYYLDERLFICGSEPQQVLTHPGVPREPNPEMIAEILLDRCENREETVWHGLMRLAPGHFIAVDGARARKARYYELDPAKTVRHSSDRDYAAHFLEIFKAAVQCRLRSNGPVASELSGGLDSSSVVSVVQSLARAGTLDARGFAAFYVADRHPEADESPWVREVARRWGLEAEFIAADPIEIDAPRLFAEHAARYLDVPTYMGLAFDQRVMPRVAERGFRVLLTGEGGDPWTGVYPRHLADLFGEFRWLATAREMAAERRNSMMLGIRARSYPALALGQCLAPHLPRGLYRRLRRMTGRREGLPPHINPRFAAETGVLERTENERPARRFSTLSQQEICELFEGNDFWNSLSVAARRHAYLGVEERHPLCDRRVIEFLTAVPWDQRWRRGWTKFVLRQAMRGLLPEAVRLRTSKGETTFEWPRMLAAAGGERLFTGLNCAKRGWVNEAAALAMYREMSRAAAAGGDYGATASALSAILGIEAWLSAGDAVGRGVLTARPASSRIDFGLDSSHSNA